MALVMNPDGSRFVIDCNITQDNKNGVLTYTQKILGKGNVIDAFINTHRDSDHMRGINDLHSQHTIKVIWDTDVPGTTTDSPEYIAYMRLRRTVNSNTIKPNTYFERGTAKYRFMNGKREDYVDANEQSAVVKVEFKTPKCSVLFAADTNYRPWKEKILASYDDSDLKSELLIAAHHGSITFFDDPSDTKTYFVDHIQNIKPAMTIVSVGPNKHGLPDAKAIELYTKYSTGSNNGDKVYTTKDKHNMIISLKDNGGWSVEVDQ